MNADLTKFNQVEVPLSQEERTLCRDQETIRVGDHFFHGDQLLRISRIEETEQGRRVYYDCVEDLERNEVIHPYGSELLDVFISSHRGRFVPDPSRLYQQAVGFSDGSFLPEELLELPQEETDAPDSSVSDLVTCTSAETLEAMAQRSRLMERRMDDLIAMSNYHAEVLRRRMQEKMGVLRDAASHYRKQLTKAVRILSMIQLYLGEDQTVEQVLTGEPAGVDVPLTLHQQVLFMAEECAILTDGGIDANRIDEFVDWLKADRHIDLILPDPKGIVALKPSRFTKQYGDPAYEEMMRLWNRHTYFLIRNGENVYLLESDHIEVSERMFPLRKEMQEIMDRIHSTEPAIRKKDYQNEFESKDERYRRIVIFLQGLLDSTEILHPIRPGINLFHPDSAEGAFRLVYDDEPSLTDGHVPFKVWRDQINASLKRGSRIVFVRNTWNLNLHRSHQLNRFIQSHFLRQYSDFSMPDIPESGVYTLEEIQTCTSQRLGFKYLPERKYVWDVEYTRRVTYLLDDDDLYLNYDGMSLEDVDYYLNCRLERKNYLTVLPTLLEMRKALRKEQAEEQAFRQMLQGRLMSKGISEARSANVIDQGISWWKDKTIQKRPIRSDDAKAMRMIERWVNQYLSGQAEET